MPEDEGHEWGERKGGERKGLPLPPAGMTHPGRQPVAPCGSWVLIRDSLSGHKLLRSCLQQPLGS